MSHLLLFTKKPHTHDLTKPLSDKAKFRFEIAAQDFNAGGDIEVCNMRASKHGICHLLGYFAGI